MYNYDEAQVYAFLEDERAAYAEAGHELDAYYPIWTARMQYDAVSLGYPYSRPKHLNELRIELGLSPSPVPPEPTPIPPDPVPPSTPTDIPPLTSGLIAVEGSDPACLKFPETARFAALGIEPGQLTINLIGADSWPPVDVDGAAQAGTLWVVLYCGGKWVATGAERLRPQQIQGSSKPEDQNIFNWIPVSWLYDAARWPSMAGHVPRIGETVGMFVVAGSTRSDNQTPLDARTNLIEFLWPGPSGSWPVGGPRAGQQADK